MPPGPLSIEVPRPDVPVVIPVLVPGVVLPDVLRGPVIDDDDDLVMLLSVVRDIAVPEDDPPMKALDAIDRHVPPECIKVPSEAIVPGLGGLGMLGALADRTAGFECARLMVVVTTGAVIRAAASRPAAIFAPRCQVCGCESTTGACCMTASGTVRTLKAARWMRPRPRSLAGMRNGRSAARWRGSSAFFASARQRSQPAACASIAERSSGVMPVPWLR